MRGFFLGALLQVLRTSLRICVGYFFTVGFVKVCLELLLLYHVL